MSIFQATPPARRTLSFSLGIETALITSLKTTEELTEQVVLAAIQDSFSLVYTLKEVKTHLDQLVERVHKRLETASAETSSKSSVHYGKSLGTQYSGWLDGLTAEQLCLYLADYDTERAYHIYWFTDLDWFQEAIKLRSQYDSHVALIQMEACLYGFGGKYEDDGGRHVNNHDINTDETMAALRKCGF